MGGSSVASLNQGTPIAGDDDRLHSAVRLGGSATALRGKNVVKPDDLAKNSVGKRAIVKNGVGAAETAAKSVGSSEVIDNSLGGADINEGSLGKVPSATNADTLGGLSSSAFALAKVGQSFFTQSNTDIDDYPNGSTIVSLSLPAGKFAISAQISHDNDGGGSDTTCTLTGGGLNAETEFSEGDGASEPDGMAVPFVGVASSASSFTAAVTCLNNGGNDDILSRSMAAVQLAG
jgi:hypothetical protein